MKALDHGRCPNCDVDLNAFKIWDYFYTLHGNEERADQQAEMYGATRTEGYFGREIGIYSIDEDRTVRDKCPDCNHEWEV